MIFSIILLIFLIFINGVFSASELAFLSVDKIQLKKDVYASNKRAIMVDKILKDTSSFLSVIQIGITLAGFLASAFAADYFANYFLNIISVSFISYDVLKSILVVLITILLSYFTLVFGELVPKKIAINNSYKLALKMAPLIMSLKVVFYPLIKLLTFSVDLICKCFNIKDKDNEFSLEDIKKMILLGLDEGVIEEKEKEYILNIFEFNDKDVFEVMTPKRKVVFLDANDDLKENILKVKTSMYSRFPVLSNGEVIGVFNVKDFIVGYSGQRIELRDIIRPIMKFNYDEKIDDVFRCMQEKSESFSAIYKDGEFIGIVTLEDAVEEIVGNIYDEYDERKEVL